MEQQQRKQTSELFPNDQNLKALADRILQDLSQRLTTPGATLLGQLNNEGYLQRIMVNEVPFAVFVTPTLKLLPLIITRLFEILGPKGVLVHVMSQMY